MNECNSGPPRSHCLRLRKRPSKWWDQPAWTSATADRRANWRCVSTSARDRRSGEVSPEWTTATAEQNCGCASVFARDRRGREDCSPREVQQRTDEQIEDVCRYLTAQKVDISVPPVKEEIVNETVEMVRWISHAREEQRIVEQTVDVCQFWEESVELKGLVRQEHVQWIDKQMMELISSKEGFLTKMDDLRTRTGWKECPRRLTHCGFRNQGSGPDRRSHCGQCWTQFVSVFERRVCV